MQDAQDAATALPYSSRQLACDNVHCVYMQCGELQPAALHTSVRAIAEAT
jgi:hypothetical protein